MDDDDRFDFRLLAAICLLLASSAHAEINISNDGATRWQCVELIDGERVLITPHVTQSEAIECLLNQQTAHPERDYRAVSAESLRVAIGGSGEPEHPEHPTEPEPDPEHPTEPDEPTDPGHPDEPDDPPVEPTDPPTASCGSPYRGIPDPCAHLGYDVYADYEVDQVLTGNLGDAHLSGTGTAADPFVIDASAATFETIELAGQYIILQGATVNAPAGSGPMIKLSGAHGSVCGYSVVRDVHLIGPKVDSSHSSAVAMGCSNVWLRGSIHGFGDNRIDAREQDFHGAKVFGPDVWILDAEIYDVSGDSVQVGDANGQANRVYIGGGYFHHNRENAVDIKDSRNVVVSGVKMEGFRPTSSSPGEAVIIHDDAFDARIYDNVILDTNIGIVSSGASGHVIEGNDITALREGIQLRNTSNLTVRGNTITAPVCVARQSGVSGDVQTGCE